MEDKQITQSVDNLVNDNSSQPADNDGLSLAANPLAQTISPASTVSDDNSSDSSNQQTGGDSLEEVLSEDNNQESSGSNPKPKKDEPKPSSVKTDPELEPIKIKALSELEPIIDELDLEPEEKFRTMLMIIQASDNKSLIKKTYKVAEEIKDKKIRAQALLSIVNEIDYFSGKETSN